MCARARGEGGRHPLPTNLRAWPGPIQHVPALQSFCSEAAALWLKRARDGCQTDGEGRGEPRGASSRAHILSWTAVREPPLLETVVLSHVVEVAGNTAEEARLAWGLLTRSLRQLL